MTVWTWDPDSARFVEQVAGTAEAGGEILLADSWLVSDGRIRALERHRERFFSTAVDRSWLPVGSGGTGTATGSPTEAAHQEQAPHAQLREHADSEHVQRIWEAAIALLPRSGDWFPRIEILAGRTAGTDRPERTRLNLRLRPAPPLGREIAVLVPDSTDPRTTPDLKGPDLTLLTGLRERARTEHGSDEVLLLNEHGHVVEAATSNLLWWEAGTLCLPAPELAPFSGVTVALVTEEARRRGIPVRRAAVTPEHLMGHEVWLLNALHGIRRVSTWHRATGSTPPATAGSTPPATADFGAWRTWLSGLATPLPPLDMNP